MDNHVEHLAPLPYHIELRNYLKVHERELWNYFASAQAKAEFTENLRINLLKSTYRLDPEAHPDLVEIAEKARRALQLDIPVTMYQAQDNSERNATLCYIPGEGHIVFSGPILTLLHAEELQSVIGHELAHFLLWECENGEFQIADRVITAAASDPRAAASHEQTARRYQLYTEIFADRGSLCATGELHPVVAGLVKIQTGLAQVSAASYLRQAEEIFANGNVASLGLSHPEAFIRARALSLWQVDHDGSLPEISAMIEGPDTFPELDLIGQERLANATRRLLEYFLQPKWFQTAAVLGHAKLFFNDFEPAKTREPAFFKEPIFSDSRSREYLTYLLLDFVTADPELADMPLAAALDLARELNWNSQFEKLIAKELKLKPRELKRIKDQAAQMLAEAEPKGD